MRLQLKWTVMLFFATLQLSFAQEKNVSGMVTDESGIPLPGVTILVKESTKGTQTDFDGNYQISVQEGKTLVFSYVGMKSAEKKVGKSSVINVVLKTDAQELGEVVVTGVAGATSVKKLSVTVGKVGKETLENMPTSSAASALQGKLAGVTVTNLGQPGSGANIQLRGATNLFGSQKPLILIDGVIAEGGLADINTDDIESFEVVKGASASALYGSRAGNGVIVITTKRGTTGKLQITFKSEIGFSSLAKKYELSGSHQYKLASDWEKYKGVFTKYDGVVYPANYNGVNYSKITGGRKQKDDHYQDNPYGVYRDPQDAFFRTGIDRNIYTSLSAATEKSKVFFSAEAVKNQGVFAETDGYNRYSSRLNADIKITDNLKFATSNAYLRTINNTPGGFSSSSHLLFNALKVSPDTDIKAKNLDGQPYIYVPSIFESTNTNALYDLYKNKRKEISNKFLGSYSLNYKIIDPLTLDLEYALEAYNTNYTSYNPYDTYTGGGSKGELYAFYSKGSLSKSSSYSISQKAQATLNYMQSFGDLILKGKLSYLLENYQSEYFYGRGEQLLYPGIASLDNFTKDKSFIGSDERNEVARNFFGIIGFDYKDRYILDAMYRYDGSSLFGENNRWNPYYRISGAYRISKDLTIPGIQELKVHVAHGTSGQRPGFTWQYDYVELEEGNLSTDRIKSNPDLKPSKTIETEFGLTSDFLNRFHLEFVYSRARTEDQFMLVNIPAPINKGANRQWQNVGVVDFSTYEVSLGIKTINSDNFKWDTNFIFEKSKNTISELNVDPIFVGPNSQDAEIFRIEEGVEFGSMYGNKFVHSLDEMAKQLPSGKKIEDYVVNRDGVVVEKSLVGTEKEKAIKLQDENGKEYFGVIGSQTPDFKMSMSNTFQYKDFSFYILLDWKKGGDVYNKTAQWLTRDNRNKIMDQAGVPVGEKKTTDYYQSLYNVSLPTDFWVEDASYVKLREASLFYTLRNDKLKNIGIQSVRMGVTGRNLLTFTKYSGWDPEVQSYGSKTRQYFAYDYAAYPLYRSYNMSLTVKF